MNKDLAELFDSLKSHHVEFLVIGAHAVSFHARPRMTQDIEIWVGRELENTKRLRDALSEFGAPIGDEGAKKLSELDRQMIRIGAPPHMVDILNFAEGGDFYDIFSRRIRGSIEEVELHFPSREDLIVLKKASGRKQDLADVESLEKYR